MLGCRSTEASRIEAGGTFFTLVGGDGGGQLAQAIKTYYYPSQASQPMATLFLVKRLVDFLIDTQWPEVYAQRFASLEEYAFDLPRRAEWKTATRQGWAALVQTKLANAIRMHLPTLEMIFRDYFDEPAKLVREVQALGDMVLSGDGATKLPFWHIEDIEKSLTQHFHGMVVSERDEGHDTGVIVEKLANRLKASKLNEKAGGEGRIEDEDMKGPKPGQMTRALAAQEYTRLEVKYTTALQADRMTNEEVLEMLMLRRAARLGLGIASGRSVRGQCVSH